MATSVYGSLRCRGKGWISLSVIIWIALNLHGTTAGHLLVDNSTVWLGEDIDMSPYNDLPECPGTHYLSADETYRFLQPLNYPNNYPSDCNVQWVITSDTSDSSFVQLTYEEINLETSSSCSNKYIQIYDGYSTSPDRTLCELPSSQTNRNYVSTSNRVKISFKSDGSNQYDRFVIGYRAIDNQECGATHYLSANDTYKVIESSNYPHRHRSSCNILWVIISYKDFVQLTFDIIDLEMSENGSCLYDYIKIYDGYSVPHESRKLCTSPSFENYGIRPPSFENENYVSTTNCVTISFTSVGSNQQSHFRIGYKATEEVSNAENQSEGLSVGAVLGICWGAILLLVGFLAVIRVRCRKRRTQGNTKVQRQPLLPKFQGNPVVQHKPPAPVINTITSSPALNKALYFPTAPLPQTGTINRAADYIDHPLPSYSKVALPAQQC